MLKLEKQKIEVYDNDPVHLTIELTSNQAGEGIYRLYPSVDDEIKLIIYKKEDDVTPTEIYGEYYADMSDPENLVIDIINTEDIPEGSYWIDITYTVNADNETYNVVKQQEIMFRRR